MSFNPYDLYPEDQEQKNNAIIKAAFARLREKNFSDEAAQMNRELGKIRKIIDILALMQVRLKSKNT